MVFVSLLPPPLEIQSGENSLIVGKSKKHARKRDAISNGTKCAICEILFITTSSDLHLSELKGNLPSPLTYVRLEPKMTFNGVLVSSSFAVRTQNRYYGLCH